MFEEQPTDISMTGPVQHGLPFCVVAIFQTIGLVLKQSCAYSHVASPRCKMQCCVPAIHNTLTIRAHLGDGFLCEENAFRRDVETILDHCCVARLAIACVK
mmetsp:Transcript_94574/g.267018  ORF Transcript_94574/g.267018 Transcript_94574/m.267018 type:complete len:101 (-) Transcript_94574:354-656(-)